VTFAATPFGWKHVVYLGDISTARGTEMTLPLWLRSSGPSARRCSTRPS